MITERLFLISGAARRWHVSVTTAEGAPVDLSAYQFYGGAASRSRTESRTMSLISATPAEVVLELAPLPYGEWWHHQIYMREPVSGREWLLAGGRIEVQERLGADAASPTYTEEEGYLSFTLGGSGTILGGTLVAAGPQGPRGEKGEQGVQGEKGDPMAYDDLTAAQRADLVAQPYHASATLEPLHAGIVLDLGELTGDLDLSALSFEPSPGVQTAELWCTTGATVPVITWPPTAIWPWLQPSLAISTAYRFVIRREPSGQLIINTAYEYPL